MTHYDHYWGMHLLWWAFWIFAMTSVFGFNIPERTRVNSIDPLIILKRRLAKGEISEVEYKQLTTHLSNEELILQKDITPKTRTTSLAISKGHPLVEGLCFSVTWAFLYSVCTLFYWIAPDATATVSSKLFHGLSFTQMAKDASPFGLGDFVSVLTIGAVYSFAIGIIWSLTHTFFYRQSTEKRLERIKKEHDLRPHRTAL